MDTKERTRQPQRRRPASAPTGRKPQRRTSQPTRQPAKQVAKDQPEVVYLPAQRFSRNRLILHLATVAAVVLAVVLGLSVFFRVDESKITVSGGQKYSAWEVAQASGIKDGDNLLTFNRAKAA